MTLALSRAIVSTEAVMVPAATAVSPRTEWRAVALSLAALLGLFGAGWAWSTQTGGEPLGPAAMLAVGIALLWLLRAGAGALTASREPLSGAALDAFRDRAFWSRPARASYAAVLLCDGLFLLELAPHHPAVLFACCGAAALFSREVGAIALALALLLF